MVRDIIKYPNSPEVRYTEDVRKFDEELFSLIEDIKDTMNENNLNALTAFQIGSKYSVVVVKKDNGEYLELINPRVIRHNGFITTTESTAYYDGLTAEVKRFKEISVVYQDRDSNQKSLEASDELAVTLQRKIDFNYGATFILKLAPKERERFEKELEKKFGKKEDGNFKMDSLIPGLFKKRA